MGIKKDAFFRDAVRIRLAFQQDWKALYFNELKPAFTQAGGNVDKAIQLVLSEPAKYPKLNDPAVSKEEIDRALRMTDALMYKTQPTQQTDILQDVRKNQEAVPRTANFDEGHEYAEKFFSVLQANHRALFTTLDRNDQKEIADIFDKVGSHGQRLEEISKVIKKARIRGFFQNFNSIKGRIEALPVRTATKLASVYRVIFAYLDNLDRGM